MICIIFDLYIVLPLCKVSHPNANLNFMAVNVHAESPNYMHYFAAASVARAQTPCTFSYIATVIQLRRGYSHTGPLIILCGSGLAGP